jgi:hypothetical protein
MDKTKFARIDAEQHRVIKEAAKKQGIIFQSLLKRVIKVGVAMMRLEEK